jgi:hypothetical protein
MQAAARDGIARSSERIAEVQLYRSGEEVRETNGWGITAGEARSRVRRPSPRSRHRNRGADVNPRARPRTDGFWLTIEIGES